MRTRSVPLYRNKQKARGESSDERFPGAGDGSGVTRLADGLKELAATTYGHFSVCGPAPPPCRTDRLTMWL